MARSANRTTLERERHAYKETEQIPPTKEVHHFNMKGVMLIFYRRSYATLPLWGATQLYDTPTMFYSDYPVGLVEICRPPKRFFIVCCRTRIQSIRHHAGRVFLITNIFYHVFSGIAIGGKF